MRVVGQTRPRLVAEMVIDLLESGWCWKYCVDGCCDGQFVVEAEWQGESMGTIGGVRKQESSRRPRLTYCESGYYASTLVEQTDLAELSVVLRAGAVVL